MKNNVIARLGEQYGVDANNLFNVLAATAFKQKDGVAPSVEQMMALSIVADQYGLNPFIKEIYAFPDKQNGIVPVVGVDGWTRIINSHPQLDGIEFEYSEKMVTPEGANTTCYEWVKCIIHRKDLSKPVAVPEYLDEVYRKPFIGKYGVVIGPWQTHPKRFLRHKALIQAGRIAFGFAGIYDQDEASRIIEQQERDMGFGAERDITPRPTVSAQPVAAHSLQAVITAEQKQQLINAATVAGVDEAYVCQKARISHIDELQQARLGAALNHLKELSMGVVSHE